MTMASGLRSRVARLAALGLLAATLAMVPGSPAAGTTPGTTTQVSVSSDGNAANDASYDAAVSGNGRYIAFGSLASNLVSGDTNEVGDVFVRDMLAGSTSRVSVDNVGNQANGSSQRRPAISADGRYVAFASMASNLVPGEDTNATWDVFLRDIVAGTTTRVSVAADGSQSNGTSDEVAVSGDGRYVAFSSAASNLVPGDNNNGSDVFVWDRVTGTTTKVSIDIWPGGDDNQWHSGSPAISADGRFVAMQSAYPPSGDGLVFVRDQVQGTTALASVGIDGSLPQWPADHPAISADGRYVAFDSAASNLVPNDTNGNPPWTWGRDVFVRDMVTGTTARVSVDSAGSQTGARSWYGASAPAISGDGRYVAFESSASDLVPDDPNGDTPDIFVRDTVAGTTTRVDFNTGTPPNGASHGPSMSSSGQLVAFWGRWGGSWQVYARDAGGPPAPVRYAALGDSYSSGEGLPSTYLAELGGGECGRAPLGAVPGTYAQQLDAALPDGSAFAFLACSGEIASEIERDQVPRISTSTDLVTLTAGGNTVGFPEMAAFCVAVTQCDQRLTSLGSGGQDVLSQRIQAGSTYHDLFHLYSAIKTRAPGATVMVVGYPQLVVPPQNRRVGCMPEFDNGEIEFIRSHTDELNGVIRGVAADAGVRYVDVTDTFDSARGGMCGDRAKINELQFPYFNGSIHPNGAGHDAFFQAVVAGGALQSPLPANPVAEGENTPSTVAPDVEMTSLTVQTVTGQCAGVLVPIPILVPLLARDCPVRAVVDNLGGYAEAHLRLHSDPVEVATATADANGVATFAFTLPAGTEPGAHVLEVDEPGTANGSRLIAAGIVGVAHFPDAPTTLTATPSDRQVELTWTAPTDDGGLPLARYLIYRDDVVVHTTDDASTSSFTDTGLTNGRSYSYAVTAVNDLGQSEQSAPVTATPAAPGGISGTVTETGSGSPVAGAWVALLRTSDFSIAGGAVANGSGDYSVQVPPGSYYLYVVDSSGTHTAGFHGPPTTVTVTAGAITDADPQMAPTRGAIAGTVTDAGSGTPIGGAWVIGINATTGATQQGVVANGAGQYNIAGLAVGSYRPVFVDPTGAHASRYYPNSVDFLGATSLAVTAGGSTAANVALPTQSTTPGAATLSGTVREAGTNTALGGVFVVALRASDFRNAGGAVTNASGQYSLNVAAGDYKLAFVDSTGLHDMEWHDNQPNTGLATATSVTAPAVTDAALDANTGTLAGTITDDPSGSPLSGAWVVAIGPTGAIVGGAVTAANGTYTLAGLAPGTYRATFVDPNGGRTQEYFNNSPDYAGATPINVTAANTAAVNAALALP